MGKTEEKRKERLCKRNKKTLEHKSDGDTYRNWCTRYSHQKIGTRTGGLGNKWTNGDHPNGGIIKIGQNIEKSPGHSTRFTVTPTQRKNHQLTLV